MCWDAGEYLPRFVIVGNSELGDPSCTLFRSDVLDRSEAAWDDEMSWDLVANVLAAVRGDVVLLPPGLVTVGKHQGQDTYQQSIKKYHARFTNTIDYLSSYPDANVSDIAARIACTESLYQVALTAQQLLRFRRVGLCFCPWSLRTIAKYYAKLQVADFGHALSRFRWVLQFWRRRYQLQLTPDVEEVGGWAASCCAMTIAPPCGSPATLTGTLQAGTCLPLQSPLS